LGRERPDGRFRWSRAARNATIPDLGEEGALDDVRNTTRAAISAAAGPVQAFFRTEAAGGIVLLACALAALGWANLAGESYRLVFHTPVSVGFGSSLAQFTLVQLANDALMAIFFFLVGMEIKHELVDGELRTLPQALLPGIAALGGMVVPVAVYLAFNAEGAGRAGWGIAMATDIAFCIGILTLLRSRVSHALVVFVTALAIFDDIGGILVIALFYGEGLDAGGLAAAAVLAAVLVAMSRARVRRAVAWAAAGVLLWIALHRAGIHATIAGVALGLAIPARPDGAEEAPLARFERALHPWVAFAIMPLFALANAGLDLGALDASRLGGGVAVGTALALLVGKPVGILAFALAAVKLGVAPLPRETSVAKLLGAAMVAGIGFTVALFIATLAFPEGSALLDEAKAGILAGSLLAGVAGAAVLMLTRATAR
jgi:NhaA family Na+:H+ antiporter